MQRTRKCYVCKKELDEFEGCIIPYSRPATYDFPLAAGGVRLYCEECYKEAIKETATEVIRTKEEYEELRKIPFQDIKKSDEQYNHIQDKIKAYKDRNITIRSIGNVSTGQNVTVVGQICSNITTKEIIKPDRMLKISYCQIKDDTGEITLILWNLMGDKIQSGEVYRIDDGYIQEFGGKKQITLGHSGTIEKISL